MEIKCLVQFNEHQFIRIQITHMTVLNTIRQQQGNTFIATTQSNVSVMFKRNLLKMNSEIKMQQQCSLNNHCQLFKHKSLTF